MSLDESATDIHAQLPARTVASTFSEIFGIIARLDSISQVRQSLLNCMAQLAAVVRCTSHHAYTG